MIRLVLAIVILVLAGLAHNDVVRAETKFNFTTQKRQLAERFDKQTVRYRTQEKAGTIVIDTKRKYLYLVLGDSQALRYGIGVGREGHKWKGTERISKKAKWPSWTPPAEMLARQPDLPTFMPGGEDNPLGARALYLGGTLYRIHGTLEGWSIGRAMSSGCIRMLNEHVIDLYDRVKVGTKVVVN
jgi:lipoprotein-anchoring transpeptidase ErfK/SrfK